jgi:outer membrane receptor protein involved in Fe transport
MPSLIQSGLLNQTKSDLFLQPTPSLRPTITQSVSVEYDHEEPELYSKFKISSFYEYVKDVSAAIAIQQSPQTIFSSVNVGDSSSVGFELGLNGEHNGLRWGGSYSFAQVRDSADVAANIGFHGSAPEHHGRLRLGYTHDKLELDSFATIVSSTNAIRDQTFTKIPENGYMSVGGRVGYNLTPQITAAVSGQNVNHRYIPASSFPKLERQMFLSITARF